MRHATCIVSLMGIGIGCGTTGEPMAAASRTANSPTDIVLSIGQEVLVDARLRVGFTSVPQDSRCPSSVVCVWAGDGAAELSFHFGTDPSLRDTLHTMMGRKQTGIQDYDITLLELMPYPAAPGAIPPDAYAVRLRIARRPA